MTSTNTPQTPVQDAPAKEALKTPGQVAQDKARELISNKRAEHAKQVATYNEVVDAIFARQDDKRRGLYETLGKRIESREVTTANYQEALDQIDLVVSNTGKPESWVFNHSSDPKYRRTQGFELKLDEELNITATYSSVSESQKSGVTGQPVAPGTRVWMMNPYEIQAPTREKFIFPIQPHGLA